MKARRFIFLLVALSLAGIAGAVEPPPPAAGIRSHIPWQEVESSGLAAVGYSKRRQILEVKFNNGAVYRYLNVAPSVYRKLISADSKARYFIANIRGNYRVVRVRPRVNDRSAN